MGRLPMPIVAFRYWIRTRHSWRATTESMGCMSPRIHGFSMISCARWALSAVIWFSLTYIRRRNGVRSPPTDHLRRIESHIKMTTSNSTINTIMRKTIHHPLPFSSDSRTNFFIFFIASLNRESVLSTLLSRSFKSLKRKEKWTPPSRSQSSRSEKKGWWKRIKVGERKTNENEGRSTRLRSRSRERSKNDW